MLLYSIYLIPAESRSIPAGMQLFWWNPVPFLWIPVDSSRIWPFLQEWEGHQEVLGISGGQ